MKIDLYSYEVNIYIPRNKNKIKAWFPIHKRLIRMNTSYIKYK